MPGAAMPAALEEIDPALFDEIFHLNVLGLIVAMWAVIPLMRAQGGISRTSACAKWLGQRPRRCRRRPPIP
jgi:NAD(P)-dependent dehydrogenase (short-subunit alcohol dehydrogenase family)